MPVTKDPKTGKVTHHSYSPKSRTYDKAIAAGQTAVANPHTGRPPKLRAKKLKDQKGRTGKLTPSYGDVSTTGRTGPKKAPNLKVAEGASVRPLGRKTSAEKRAILKKHPSTAIAMNSEGKYIHGDTYRPEMKKAGYNRI